MSVSEQNGYIVYENIKLHLSEMVSGFSSQESLSFCDEISEYPKLDAWVRV